MTAIFLIVEVEKIYAPKYIMPLLHTMGMCKPTDQSVGHVMTDEELNAVLFLATSASTMGVPVAHH